MAVQTERSLEQRDAAVLVHPLTSVQQQLADGPLVIERGQGVRLWDARGNEYMDTLSGLWNVAVGYGRPEFAQPIAAQVDTLAYVPSFFGISNRPAIELAERVVGLLPDGLEHLLYTNGGSESNETAFKLVRYYWHQRGKPNKMTIIGRSGGYHGLTIAATTATGIPLYKDKFGPMAEGFAHTLAPYPYRPPCGGTTPEECGELCAQALEATIWRVGAENVAAFIAEPILGAGGLIPPPENYLKRVREICTANDVLFIADEVITGFGRTGEWFATQYYGATPDVLCMAKAITSGYLPLGAVAFSREVYSALAETDSPFMHGFTYNGHPTCCVAGLVNLDIIEREGLLRNATARGEQLRARLRERVLDLPLVGEVRGVGLMAAVELVKDKATREKLDPARKLSARTTAAARRNGLLLRSIGDTHVFAPPLVITAAEIDEMADRYERMLVPLVEELARA